jgi:hypothetical protein
MTFRRNEPETDAASQEQAAEEIDWVLRRHPVTRGWCWEERHDLALMIAGRLVEFMNSHKK